MKPFACLALAVLWFPYAETPQPAPTLRSNVIAVPIAPAQPEPDRRCSLPGEMEQCRTYCSRIGGVKRTEPGWNPNAPVVLASYQPQAVLLGCDVRTIGGSMTLVCTCGDPGLQT